MNITVSIVEDDMGTRNFLCELLTKSKGFCCASQHSSGENAIEQLPAAKPQVVLMDLNLPGISGAATVRGLKELCPASQFIMLTVNQDLEAIFGALKAGATGYLLKSTPEAQILNAIREVCAGGSPLTSQLARKIIQFFQEEKTQSHEAEELSPRELEVLALLAKGYLYKEIADLLSISYATVNTHTRHIYEKLHVRSRNQAVAKYLSQPGSFQI